MYCTGIIHGEDFLILEEFRQKIIQLVCFKARYFLSHSVGNSSSSALQVKNFFRVEIVENVISFRNYIGN